MTSKSESPWPSRQSPWRAVRDCFRLNSQYVSRTQPFLEQYLLSPGPKCISLLERTDRKEENANVRPLCERLWSESVSTERISFKFGNHCVTKVCACVRACVVRTDVLSACWVACVCKATKTELWSHTHRSWLTVDSQTVVISQRRSQGGRRETSGPTINWLVNHTVAMLLPKGGA